VFDEPRSEDEWLSLSAESSVRRPSLWLNQAGILKAAGDAVWEDQDRLRQELFSIPTFSGSQRSHELLASDRMWTVFAAVMLWGFAVENVLKGLIVAADDSAVTVDGMAVGFVWQGKRGHDLRWLARRAGVSMVSPEEEAILEKLSHATRWSGRYPLPNQLGDQRTATEGEGERRGPRSIDGEELAVIRALYQRLHEQLQVASREEEERRGRDEAEAEVKRYPIALAALEEACTPIDLDGGGRVYQSDQKAETDDLDAVACAGCGLQFTLGRDTKGAVCKCGSLYVARYRYDDAFGRMALDTLVLNRRSPDGDV
jgi:hypothetical protein